MVAVVMVAVATSRPYAIHEWRRCVVHARTEAEAIDVACCLAAHDCVTAVDAELVDILEL